jgi:hypothetical protein
VAASTVLIALSEPIDVHIIGDNHWWEPFLVPLALIFAGLIAAGLSWLIHRQSLEAEERRLARRFRHERRMREREATRAVLDDAVALIERMIDATTQLISQVDTAERIRRDLEQARQEGREQDEKVLLQRVNPAYDELQKTLAQVGHLNQEAFAVQFRLRLRFPDDHPVVTAFAAWRDARVELFDTVAAGGVEPRSPQQLQRSEALVTLTGTLLGQFLEAARAWVREVEDDRPHAYA